MPKIPVKTNEISTIGVEFLRIYDSISTGEISGLNHFSAKNTF